MIMITMGTKNRTVGITIAIAPRNCQPTSTTQPFPKKPPEDMTLHLTGGWKKEKSNTNKNKSNRQNPLAQTPVLRQRMSLLN